MNKMKTSSFNTEQIEFMKKIGLDINFSEGLPDAEYDTIEEKVSGYLQIKGFDSVYEPTEEGRMAGNNPRYIRNFVATATAS